VDDYLDLFDLSAFQIQDQLSANPSRAASDLPDPQRHIIIGRCEERMSSHTHTHQDNPLMSVIKVKALTYRKSRPFHAYASPGPHKSPISAYF